MKKWTVAGLLVWILGGGLAACACHKHRCCGKPAASAEGGCHKPCQKKEGQAPCHAGEKAPEAAPAEAAPSGQ
jgi:hypothetical protein